jgi:sodium-dependent dicarboxylate transporter 2/3/5
MGDGGRAARWGFWAGLIAFAAMLLLPPPAEMPLLAWRTTAVVVLMATWWMTQALPLTATALVPFLAFPLLGIMGARETAGAYWSDILFLVLGGAIMALAIERTGLHRRLALAIIRRGGSGAASMLLAFMIATAMISLIVSNTATTLIMMPIGLAVLRAARVEPGVTDGFPGALAMGIAFAATIGGFGTIVGSPTNAISVGIIDEITGVRIDFLTWALFGLPVVLVSVPLCWVILMRVQRVRQSGFDTQAAREGLGEVGIWSRPEKRLVPLVALLAAGWVALPFVTPFLPRDSVNDGTLAIFAALLLFVIPDGTGRPMMKWEEADRAPWGVIMMFGGGLALAAGIGKSGLAAWLGTALEPLGGVHPILICAVVVGIVILVTEFASNVAAASGIMPVVGGLILATGADPILLALPAAFAASWGFMLPSGTGPNAIAWASGHIALPRMLRAGLLLDLAGIPIMVGSVWAIGALLG